MSPIAECLAAFVFGSVAGLLVQRSRFCNAAALRGAIMFKSYRNTKALLAANWFVSSTSFANPAVTLARGFTDTFAGIEIGNVPAFVLFQFVGAGLAITADRAVR